MLHKTVGRPMEILLVEDSLVDARLTMGALKKGQVPHRLTLVRDGAEAMEFLRQEGRFARAPRPDLMLLDLHLPKKDGLEVLSEVKTDYDLKSIPIVVLTASDANEDMQKCELLHVDAYINKPVDTERFIDVVRQLKRFWHANLILPVLD
jgi:two-component system, chemotaxis family, response regulator Rcp1